MTNEIIETSIELNKEYEERNKFFMAGFALPPRFIRDYLMNLLSTDHNIPVTLRLLDYHVPLNPFVTYKYCMELSKTNKNINLASIIHSQELILIVIFMQYDKFKWVDMIINGWHEDDKNNRLIANLLARAIPRKNGISVDPLAGYIDYSPNPAPIFIQAYEMRNTVSADEEYVITLPDDFNFNFIDLNELMDDDDGGLTEILKEKMTDMFPDLNNIF